MSHIEIAASIAGQRFNDRCFRTKSSIF